MSLDPTDLRALLPSPVPIAVLRTPTASSALEMANALYAGGIRAVEITLTIPGASELIAELATDGRMIVGAGTVTTPAEVELVIEAGARFVVSPGLDVDVVEAAMNHPVAFVPGAYTPTEVMAARKLGITTTKLFPANTAGPSHLAALRQVFPEIGIVPTGGIGPENVSTWIQAGACAVGIGSVINSTFATSGRHGLQELASDLIRSCEHVAAHRTP